MRIDFFHHAHGWNVQDVCWGATFSATVFAFATLSANTTCVCYRARWRLLETVSKEKESSTATDEWMYQIGGKKHWEDYNTVVRGYLRGECCDTDVAKAWAEAGGRGTPAREVPSGNVQWCVFLCASLPCVYVCRCDGP